MKSVRNILFYVVTIGIFSALLYFFIYQGQQLENQAALVQRGDPGSSSLDQFIDTFSHNLTHPLAILLLQMITIILVARIFGFLCRKIGQPSVIGEIAAGIFLGPSVAGLFFPEFSAFLFPVQSLGNLQFLSQIGLILFMFIIGMELDLKILKTKAEEAVVISHASIILPFSLGVGLALMIYDRFAPAGINFLSFALFIGIALSITAFPVLARIVQERGLSRTRLGTMAITCAATDDITAWCILAAVIAIVKAGSFVSSLYTIALAAIYVLFMLRAVRPFLKRIGDYYSYREGLTKPVVAVFFVTLLVSSYLSELIGIHALFGAFMAGVVMPSNQNFRNIFTEKVEDVSLVLLLPLFFVFTGLRTQIGLLNDPYLWQITGLIVLAAVTGKFVGSAAAARMVRQSWRDSLIIGSLMNTRGLMELVVLNIGYDIGVLSPEIFAMMVIMALVTTCMTGPSLDLIERLMPLKKNAQSGELALPSRFSVLIAFASPQGGQKMFRLVYHLLQKNTDSQTVTALHLSPTSYLNQVNTEEYQADTFRPISEESRVLGTPFTTMFRPSNHVDHDIIETANDGNYDMLMIGIGRSVFEGTFLGKILGFTSKIISPERLYGTLKGREKLFHADVFDEKTTHIIRSVKIPLGILMEKNLTKVEQILVPVFSQDDQFVLHYAQKMLVSGTSRVTIMDPSETLSQRPEMVETISTVQQAAPERVILHYGNALDREFLQQHDLLIMSLASWKKAVEAHSVWLSYSPSVLVIRD